MNNQVKIIFLISIFLTFSCMEKVHQNSFDGIRLKSLIEKSLKGDEVSKSKITGLFTFISDDFNTYNKIIIDSIQINKKKYYSVLVENQNPVYNLFGIIDENFKLLLKDESLNGYLELNWKKSGSKIFAVVNESFKSKDIIILNRVSYYSIDSLTSDIVFRQFTKIKTPDIESDQNIVFVSDTTIRTEIIKSNSTLKKDSDVFRFDVLKNQYISTKNKFDAVVINTVEGLNNEIKGFQIVDVESIRRLLGIEDDSSYSDNQTNMLSDNDFEIKLSNQWKKLGSYTISEHLKKEMKGIKFINPKIGAGISMFRISVNDSAEAYIDKPLTRSTNGIERISADYDDSKSRYKFYEFSCPDKKLILLFEAPKSTYENYRDIYTNIFKTFKIKCNV